MSTSKAYIRVCFRNKAVEFEKVRDVVYNVRFGVHYTEDLKNGDGKRALDFSEKDLNAMDNCIFFFATKKEIDALKKEGFSLQLFHMFAWKEL